MEVQHKIDFEVCPTPVLLVSPEGKILQTNKRLDKLFGYEVGELKGQAVELLVPEETQKHHVNLRDEYFKSLTTRQMGSGRDLHGIQKNGTMIPIEVGLDHLEIDGKMMVIVSVLDIRERKNSEAMIRRAINAASSGMIWINSKGKIELINDAALKMFGYFADELIGQSIEVLVPEQFRNKHVSYRVHYQKNQETRKMARGQDLFGQRKDGTKFPVEVGLTPIHEADDQATMATINDITDRKNKEFHIDQKNQYLERLNNELLQFAYSASHDLKAPLASITGLLGCCKSDLEDGDVKETIKNIDTCANLTSRLASRIEDMLTLAKSDMISGTFEDTIVKDHVDSVWSALETSHVQLETDFQHEDPIQTVPVRFSTIIENLLSNAIKFRDETKDQCIVTIRTRCDQNHLLITIEDNGIGIPIELRDKVFEVFQRAANTRKSGSGIGLSLVKKNVIHLGGMIELESKNGNTIFLVRLPQSESIKGVTED